MRLSVPLVRFLIIATALLSLVPISRFVSEWYWYAEFLNRPLETTPIRGTDGVHWTDEGDIVAEYVFPPGPGYAAGIRNGDRLYRLDYQTYFSAPDAERTIARSAGTVLAYEIIRGDEQMIVNVEIAKDPTFVYPSSASLWTAAGWGFGITAFLHVLALLAVLPLARRSRRARGSTLLIGAASVWVVGNLVRIAWISAFGIPAPSTAGSTLFDILTLVALWGWIAFPVLLLWRVLVDDRLLRRMTARWRGVLLIPPALLLVCVTLATVLGHLGPLPPDAFAAPILFYLCVYVAAATGFSLWRSPSRLIADEFEGRFIWGRVGSAAILILSAAGAIIVYATFTSYGGSEDVRRGWFLTLLQLFSLLPVGLVSIATLRYGRFEALVARSIAYIGALALTFGIVAGGALLLDSLLPGGVGAFGLAVWVVLMLVLLERAIPWFREQTRDLLQGRRRKMRREVARFTERMREIVDIKALADEAVDVVGQAFNAQSAVLFLREAHDEWLSTSYNPEPPHFTERELRRVHSLLHVGDKVWASNAELDEVNLPTEEASRLREIGVRLAVPVAEPDGETRGLLILGKRWHRPGIYDLEDVEQLKTLANQLALAGDRLSLIEREKQLVRQSAAAELSALRAQINPHFLFNTLNTIASLIDEQPQKAEQTVEALATLFRGVLQVGGKSLIPLREELELVDNYLSVESSRFSDSLRIVRRIQPQTLEESIPAFSVQTLVENAVKHGIEKRRGGGTLTLISASDDGKLSIQVQDTGPGIPALFSTESSGQVDANDQSDTVFGIGLKNVADRIEQHYQGRGSLTLDSSPKGTVAEIQIPLLNQ